MQTLQALKTHTTCEVCGNIGHLSDNCSETKKKHCISIATMGFVHKKVRGGINHAHIIKEVMEIQILLILTNLP